MKNVEFSDKEITYLLIALRKYEAQLLADESEEMEDAATDLIFVQALTARLRTVKAAK